MDFTFNEEQTLIQDQVDQFIQKEYDWERDKVFPILSLDMEMITGKNLQI
ncbi:MAG: hypothetical protein CM15mP86_06560 [Gammaproteobacteria bacterium]|nr:MAG: hypothetical protein CM15mP86_06560 [Gammaproteobacteria bacterium]